MTPHKNIWNDILDTITSWYHDMMDEKYAKETLLAIILCALAAGGYYGYRWHTNKKNHAAHQLFAQNLEEFERAAQGGKKEDWASIAMLFKLGYDQYPSSALAPYFLVYQSQALLNEEKIDEALTTLDKAISAMSSSSPIKGLYQTKAALMRLDSQDKAMHALGLEQLQAVTQDTKNVAYDVAAYHLGLYYSVNNDLEKAKSIWSALIENTKSTEKLGQSPWAEKAQAKLGQIA